MATIIKSNAALTSDRPSAPDLRRAVFNFDDMAEQANEYLGDVQNQAESILAKAHAEADAVRQQAVQAGRQSAMDAVQKMVDEKIATQLDTFLPAIGEMVDAVRKSRETLAAQWENRLISLAVDIAERVIRRRLPDMPDVTLDLVREALEMAVGACDMRLLLNPVDHETLGPRAETLVAELVSLGTTHVVADPSITPGGCRLETRLGTIDQQLDVQLRRIEEELTR